MAVRYDQKTKDEVVSFITDYNAKNGRGGQTVAASKYGVTQLTISKWLKNAGVKKGRKSKTSAAPAAEAPAKKRRGRGPGKKTIASASAATAPAPAKTGGSSQSITVVFQRMMKIREQIDALQAEFDALKHQL
jgi:hypothetical protein